MDREQALNGAALVSYTWLCFSCSNYVILFHNTEQTGKNKLCYCSHTVHFLSPSFQRIQYLCNWDLLSPQSDSGLYLDVVFLSCSVRMCVCMYSSPELSVHFHVSSYNSCPMKPNLKRIELCTCIDRLNDQCKTSIFDLFPLLWRLSGCSLIELLGHRLSTWEAERQSIPIQVT